MNWKRGLFRLWVLLSVLWIAAVVALGLAKPDSGWEVMRYCRPLTTEEIKDCDEKHGGAAWCKQSLCWEPSLTERAYDRAYDLRWYAATAIGVPLAILLFALAGRWVVGGSGAVEAQPSAIPHCPALTAPVS